MISEARMAPLLTRIGSAKIRFLYLNCMRFLEGLMQVIH